MGNPTTGINVVVNNTFFADPGSSGTNTMKRTLKWDTTRFLNIYTNNAGGGGILGYATFPSQEAGGPEDGAEEYDARRHRVPPVRSGRSGPVGETWGPARTPPDSRLPARPARGLMK